MPILASFLGAMIAGLGEFLAGFMTKKVAIYLAVSAVFAASWTALLAAVALALAGLSVTTPQVIVDAVHFALPANTAAVVTGAIAIEGVVAGFRWHLSNMRLAVQG